MKRIFHTWDKWECYPAGFYEDKPPGRESEKKELLEAQYASFLSNDAEFCAALDRVLSEWKNSCEHYLSNENMNRIAWLGQAAACISLGLPSAFRGGYHLLSEEQQKHADSVALVALNKWLLSRGEKELTAEEAESKTEANLY